MKRPNLIPIGCVAILAIAAISAYATDCRKPKLCFKVATTTCAPRETSVTQKTPSETPTNDNGYVGMDLGFECGQKIIDGVLTVIPCGGDGIDPNCS